MVYLPETHATVGAWTENTLIQYVPNAKKGATMSAERYDRYSKAKTAGEALVLGSKPADLLNDYEKGFIKVVPGQGEYTGRLIFGRKRTAAEPGSAEKAEKPEKASTPAAPTAAAAPAPAAKRDAQNVVTPERPAKEARKEDSKKKQELSAQDQELQKAKQVKLESTLAFAKSLGLDLSLAKELKECDTLEMMAERLVADRLAQLIMETVDEQERRLTDREVLSVLQLWAFKRNEARQNVLPDGQTWVKSDTLGLVRCRTGEWFVTKATQEYPHVTQMLNLWLKQRMPAEFEGDFPCSAISLNSNYAARRHRDGNNVGPSMITAFGEFTGGELAYWPDDDRSCAVEELPHNERCVLNTSKGVALFDGCRGHEVDDFKGERFSVVYFSPNKFWTMKPEQRVFLTECGFTIPDGQRLGPAVEKMLPPPRGYTGCQSLGKMFGVREVAKVRYWPKETDAQEEAQGQALIDKFESQMAALRESKVAKEALEAAAEARNAAQEVATETGTEELVKSGPLDNAFFKQTKAASKDVGPLSTPTKQPQSKSQDRLDQSVEKKRPPTSFFGASAPADDAASQAKRARVEEQAAALAAAPVVEFQPAQEALPGARRGEFKHLAELVATMEKVRSAGAVANYLRSVLHKSENVARHVQGVLQLLAPAMVLPEQVVTRARSEAARGLQGRGELSIMEAAEKFLAASEALSAGDSEAQASQHLIGLFAMLRKGSTEADILAQLLHGGAAAPCRQAVLRALAQAFALTQPASGTAPAQERSFSSADARRARLASLERTVPLAYGELGGNCEDLVSALMADCSAAQLFRACPPACGTPLLPMQATESQDVEEVLCRLSGSDVVVEHLHSGERVQVHKLGDCIAIFGPGNQDLGATLNQTDRQALKEALKSDSCVVEALLNRSEGAVTIAAFDCLYLNGKPLTRLSLQERQAALDTLVAPCDFLQVLPREHFSLEEPPTTEAVERLLKEASELGPRGLVFKQTRGEYEAGCAASSWFALVPAAKA